MVLSFLFETPICRQRKHDVSEAGESEGVRYDQTKTHSGLGPAGRGGFGPPGWVK